MDKARSSSNKHSKKRPKKSSKKSKRHRRSRSRSPYLDDSKYNNVRSSKEASAHQKIVEYSDVSSEDFSAPEAGEIQDEENSLSLSDRELLSNNNGNMRSNRTGGANTGGGSSSLVEPIHEMDKLSERMGARGGGSILSSVVDSSKFSSSTSKRKLIVGSPISSSMSSNSRSKLHNSSSPIEYNERRVHYLKEIGKDGIASPIDDENEDDEEDDKSGDSELERKRKKSKKSKKKKSKKKRKKKRNKSISSIENISDNDSVLDDDLDNLTPPLRPVTPTQWDKRYTPVRPNSISKSPMTPPLRPNSEMSIYSETSRRTPPLSQKYTASSPHTPPLVPRKSTAAAYHNSPIDVDVNSSGSHQHSHSHSHFHQSHHSYHHQPRSPGKEPSLSSSSRRSREYLFHIYQYFAPRRHLSQCCTCLRCDACCYDNSTPNVIVYLA